MKKKILICFLLLVCPFFLQAKNEYKYSGKKIFFKDNELKCHWLGPLYKEGKNSFQGMDIFGNYLISLQNTGIATLYDFNGKKLNRRGTFHLASYSETNHANVACFGNIYYDKRDKLPLLYVTRCHPALLNGMDKLLFVERIDPDKMTAQPVQKIWFNDVNHRYGRSTQFVLDRQTNMIYTYGNSINVNTTINRHPIMKFRVPKYDGPQDSLVILTEADALEFYYIEDYYNKPFNPVVQGAYVKNGLIFFPTGVGKPETPSILYVWDTTKRSMQNELDLTKATFKELEDCSEYKGSLIIQAQKNLFKIDF